MKKVTLFIEMEVEASDKFIKKLEGVRSGKQAVEDNCFRNNSRKVKSVKVARS